MATIQAPWVQYAKKLSALFAPDPNVIAAYDNDAPKVTLYVSGQDKADAIDRLLPDEVGFGNVTLAVEVVPDNECKVTVADTLSRAFAGNPLFGEAMEVPLYGGTVTYALFAPEVLQWEDDNTMSPYGLSSATVDEVVRDVLDLPVGTFASANPK